MSFIGNAIGSIVGGITGAKQQGEAAVSAANTQAASADKGIAANQQALEQLRQTLAPYVSAGYGALGAQQNMLGLNGQDAQAAAIGGIQNGAQFQALQQQGNDAILQNASATGGLRGGNTQAALAQFSPNLLNSLIQQQYSNLGGLTSIGQNAAAGTGNAGLQTGNNVAQLLQQQGAAIAGGQLAKGSVARQSFSDLLKIGSTVAGAGGF